MKGFKAFGKGMICRGKQYKENTVFEEEKAVRCMSGMHFCENPLDVLDYYPLIDSNGNIVEVAEVEALDECKTDGNKKYCTKKLKIGLKLSLSAFVKAAIGFAFEKNGGKASTGYGVQMASSGDDVQMASSGAGVKMASAGYDVKMASAGYGVQMASAGDDAKVASTGKYAQMASSGYGVQMASSGYGVKMASAGDGVKMASAGDDVKMASAGYDAVIAGIGKRNTAKGKKGSWLVLVEWVYINIEERYIPVCVKAAQIDGVVIKEDTFYKLENGEFKEA